MMEHSVEDLACAGTPHDANTWLADCPNSDWLVMVVGRLYGLEAIEATPDDVGIGQIVGLHQIGCQLPMVHPLIGRVGFLLVEPAREPAPSEGASALNVQRVCPAPSAGMISPQYS